MVYGRLGDKTFGRQTFERHIFYEMTIWATRVGRMGDSNWTFGRKNEALRLEQPQNGKWSSKNVSPKRL